MSANVAEHATCSTTADDINTVPECYGQQENNNLAACNKNTRSRRISLISCSESIEFTGKTIYINKGNYEYEDTIDALLGFGSYGAVYCGIDLRLHRKHSVYNNTAVGCAYEDNPDQNGIAFSISGRDFTNDDRQILIPNHLATLNESIHSKKPSGSFQICAPRRVAIKKVARTCLNQNEMRAMKRVRHPNLVRLIDICDAENDAADRYALFTYLVMELCDTDLDRHLRRHAVNNCLHPKELTRLIECIACGYLALYEKHIVHRDIKPQNILLIYGENQSGNDGDVVIRTAKITDFGISRIYEATESDDTAGELETLSNVAGTFYYMAPEVGANLLRFSEYDYSADMWSIGCVIYQCLTGRIPFDESAMCRLFLYCAGGNYEAYDIPDLPSNEDDNSSQANALITQLLQIDREKRATPQQFYEQTFSKASGGESGKDHSGKIGNKGVTRVDHSVENLPPNLSFASLSSALSSSSTLDNLSLATSMVSSSESDEMFTKHN